MIFVVDGRLCGAGEVFDARDGESIETGRMPERSSFRTPTLTCGVRSETALWMQDSHSHEAASLDRRQQSHKGHKGRSGSEDVAHFDVVFNLQKPQSVVASRTRHGAVENRCRTLVRAAAADEATASRGERGRMSRNHAGRYNGKRSGWRCGSIAVTLGVTPRSAEGAGLSRTSRIRARMRAL